VRRRRLWRSNLFVKKFSVPLVHVVLFDTALPTINSNKLGLGSDRSRIWNLEAMRLAQSRYSAAHI
jgi:hypothetical protein